MTAPTPAKPGAPPARNVIQPGKVNLPLPTVKAAVPTRFSAFIYGYSGSGKSYMLRSLVEDPALNPALVLVCDSGHATYQDLIDEDKFFVAETPNIDDVITMTDWLLKQKNVFRTVVIDNATELHRSALMAAARNRVATTGRGTISTLEQSDYGVARLQILNIMSTLAMRLPNVNIVVTALAADYNDEMMGLQQIVPNLGGKLAAEVPGFFDIVGYLWTKTPTANERREAEKAGKKLTPVRMLTTNQTNTVIQARNRGGKLGTEVVDPTFPRIYSLFTGRKAAAKADGQVVTKGATK